MESRTYINSLIADCGTLSGAFLGCGLLPLSDSPLLSTARIARRDAGIDPKRSS
jgi:hypothetical protein